MFDLLKTAAIVAPLLAGSLVPSALSGEPLGAPQSPAALFRHASLRIGSVNLHYVEIGTGEPVLLLPGWPEDWRAWRSVAPMLAASKRRVIILEPRGFGVSDKPATGYDLDTVANEVHAFLGIMGLTKSGGIDLVTHDVGSWIGYALASAHPDDVRRLVLSEVSMPRPKQRDVNLSDEQNVQSWHHAFNRLPDLPEALVAGHERVFLDWLFNNKALRPWAIDEEARAGYAQNLASPGTARAGFDYYRALFSPTGVSRMGKRLSTALPMPVLAIGAEGGVGNKLMDDLKESATHLNGAVLSGCGHYLPEECPQDFVNSVRTFWTATTSAQGRH